MKLPRCRPIATCPFAHGKCSSSTRLGIDAAATAQTGDSRIAVTHAIVEGLGGTIAASNRAQGGACFEVRLRAQRLLESRSA